MASFRDLRIYEFCALRNVGAAHLYGLIRSELCYLALIPSKRDVRAVDGKSTHFPRRQDLWQRRKQSQHSAVRRDKRFVYPCGKTQVAVYLKVARRMKAEEVGQKRARSKTAYLPVRRRAVAKSAGKAYRPRRAPTYARRRVCAAEVEQRLCGVKLRAPSLDDMPRIYAPQRRKVAVTLFLAVKAAAPFAQFAALYFKRR